MIRFSCLRLIEFFGKLPPDLKERFVTEMQALELTRVDTFCRFVTDQALPEVALFEGKQKAAWTKVVKAHSKSNLDDKTTAKEAEELAVVAVHETQQAVDEAVVTAAAAATPPTRSEAAQGDEEEALDLVGSEPGIDAGRRMRGKRHRLKTTRDAFTTQSKESCIAKVKDEGIAFVWYHVSLPLSHHVSCIIVQRPCVYRLRPLAALLLLAPYCRQNCFLIISSLD